MAVEIAMLLVGLWMYVLATRARDRVGRYAFAAYTLLLLVLYIGDRFGDPPASLSEIIWPAIIAEIVLLTWTWWFDRHREPRFVSLRAH